MTRNGKSRVRGIIRRLKSGWVELDAASAELDEIRSQLYRASAVGSDVTATSGSLESRRLRLHT